MRILSDLKPGTVLTVDDRLYVVIDLEPYGFFAGTNLKDYVCALDVNTFKIMCFQKDTVVNVSSE
jgi:hypothetical protein